MPYLCGGGHYGEVRTQEGIELAEQYRNLSRTHYQAKEWPKLYRECRYLRP